MKQPLAAVIPNFPGSLVWGKWQINTQHNQQSTPHKSRNFFIVFFFFLTATSVRWCHSVSQNHRDKAVKHWRETVHFSWLEFVWVGFPSHLSHWARDMRSMSCTQAPTHSQPNCFIPLKSLIWIGKRFILLWKSKILTLFILSFSTEWFPHWASKAGLLWENREICSFKTVNLIYYICNNAVSGSGDGVKVVIQ